MPSAGSVPSFTSRCGSEESKASASPGLQHVLVEAHLDLQLAAQQVGELGPGVPHQLARRTGAAARLVGDVHEVDQVRQQVAEQLPGHPGLQLQLAPVAGPDELAGQLAERGRRAGRPAARPGRWRRLARGRVGRRCRRAARRWTSPARWRSRRSCSPTAGAARSRPGTACWPRRRPGGRARAATGPAAAAPAGSGRPHSRSRSAPLPANPGVNRHYTSSDCSVTLDSRCASTVLRRPPARAVTPWPELGGTPMVAWNGRPCSMRIAQTFGPNAVDWESASTWTGSATERLARLKARAGARPSSARC